MSCFVVATCTPLRFENGEVWYTEPLVHGGYPVDTRAYFTCNATDGYVLDQLTSLTNYRHCQQSGTWHQQSPMRILSNNHILLNFF